MSKSRVRSIGANLDLLQMRGSEVITHNETEGVFIPFRKKGVFKFIKKNGKAMAIINLYFLPRRDKYGNDYMVMRSRTDEETEAGTFSEILGNARTIFGKNKYFSGNNAANPQTRAENYDDSPF